MSQFSSHVLSSLCFLVAILCILSNSSVVFINYSTKHHKVRLTVNKIQEKSSKHPISTVKYKDTQPHWEYQSLIQIDVYPWHFQPLTFKQISLKCNERLLKQSAMLFQVPVLLWDNILTKIYMRRIEKCWHLCYEMKPVRSLPEEFCSLSLDLHVTTVMR